MENEALLLLFLMGVKQNHVISRLQSPVWSTLNQANRSLTSISYLMLQALVTSELRQLLGSTKAQRSNVR